MYDVDDVKVIFNHDESGAPANTFERSLPDSTNLQYRLQTDLL